MSMRRRTRCPGPAATSAAAALTAAAVGACLLTSCASPPGPPAAAPQTAWQRVLSQVSPDGSISEQTALDAFVLAVGPLPGVRRPAGSAQVIEDGSGAVRWLLGYYSELTAAQRAAVRRLLRLPVTASRQSAAAGVGRGAHPATLDAMTRPAAAASLGQGNLAADQALEQQAAAEITSRLGVKLTLRVQVVENLREQGPPRALAYTACADAAGLQTGTAPAAQCTIFMNPSAHSGRETVHAVMLHEVFHCFEAQLESSIGTFNSASKAEPWLIEGAAEWVGSDFVTHEPNTAGWWLDYLTHPTRPLFERTYDAIGWIGHLYPGGGVSPWAVLPAMIRAPDSVAAYNAATAGASANFLDTEASVFFEDSSLGQAWYQNGVQGVPPGTAAANVISPASWAISPSLSPVQQVTVGTGQSTSLSARPYSDTVLSLRLSAQVTEITVVSGHARLRSVRGTSDYVNPGTLYLCTASGPCSDCPAVAKLTRFASPSDLALDGGPDRALVRVHGMSAKDLCDQPPPAECGRLPSLGPPGTEFDQSVGTGSTGFTYLSCHYWQPQGPPYGFILIETFRTPAAAAAFFKANIEGDPVPGFAQPARFGQTCASNGVCNRNEFALHGYRIDEISQTSSPPLTYMPPLAETNALMHRLLAVT